MYIDFSELVNRYNSGERDFSQVDCYGSGCDLQEINLQGIDLRGAKLIGVVLRDANLEGVNLSGANITRSNLSRNNLSYADLSRIKSSYLSYTNLQGANLTEADLKGSSLIECNLKNANLQGANLGGADLRGADLTGANLTNTDLTEANLCSANLTNAVLPGIPDAIFGRTIMPDGEMSRNQAIDLIVNKLDRLKRKAWKPITVPGDTNLTASKFAGKPWLSAGETYPTCPHCQNPMQFFLQLNLSELPEDTHGKFGDGLLQLFYCTDDEISCDINDGWEPFSNIKLVRIIDPVDTPASVEMPKFQRRSASALIEGNFLPRQIVGWQEMDDYPDWTEAHELHEIQCDETEFNTIVDSGFIDKNDIQDYSNYYSDPEIIKAMEEDQHSYIITNFMDNIGLRPLRGDKLAGYPNWVQSVEYPNCPICDRRMDRFIFEIASDDNIPYLWGDVGTGYIVQCPDHKDRVAFLWQCG
jgi:uncharacterized protein YwqG